MGQAIDLAGRWLTFPIVRAGARMIPRFVDPALVAPILPYLPSEKDFEAFAASRMEEDVDIPREVSAPVVTALKEFWEATQAAYREHASTLDKAHDILAHHKDLRFGSLEKIARRLLQVDNQPLTPPVLHAVRRALLADTSGFSFDKKSHGQTQMFQIRSKDQTEALRQVRQWIRDFQEIETVGAGSAAEKKQRAGWKIIRDFVDKSRKLIRESRERRPSYKYGGIGPSNTKLPFNSRSGALQFRSFGKFDENDRLIIRFLEAWSIHKAFVRDYAFAGLPPTLIRATGMYDDLDSFGRSAGYIFLQEIGVLEPYANCILYDANLLLPSSQHSRPLQQLATSLEKLQPKDVRLPDRMADLRHHWTDLNVFCIDAKGTTEVDDGISVERIPGSPTEHWLHIHVANPTAFIERDSIFARMAAHLTETFYSAEKNYWLLPHWMSTDLFSLGPDRPCLTFSARLDDQGNLLDAKIQSAVIHKVRHLSYIEANKLLGFEGENTGETLTIGGDVEPPAETPLPTLREDEIDDLRLLQKLAFSRKQFRLSRGSLHIYRSEPTVHVLSRPGVYGLPDTYPHRTVGLKVIGDPVLQMTTHPFRNWFGDFASAEASVSDAMVREAMLVACETAARWASERSIPMLYRGADDGLTRDDRIRFEQEVLRPAMDANGGVAPMWASLEYMHFFALSVVGPKPLKHVALGLDHYVKTTSPLRRYGDMLTHWQIEAALRLEAQTGRSLVGQTHHLGKLPFSEEQVAAVATRLHPREKLIERGKFYSQEFWQTMFMMRSHFYGELPAEKQKWKFNVLVINTESTTYFQRWGMGVHLDWGLLVHIVATPDLWKIGAEGALPGGGAATSTGPGWEPELGDVWEFEMVQCDLYWRVLAGKLTKLVSRRAL